MEFCSKNKTLKQARRQLVKPQVHQEKPQKHRSNIALHRPSAPLSTTKQIKSITLLKAPHPSQFIPNNNNNKMKSISVAMAVVLLAFSLCHAENTQQNPTLAGNDLVAKTCSSTPYNDLCKAILQSSPKSNGADLYGLAHILMDIAAENVTNIYDSINQLQNDSNIDSFMDECLTDCLESYQDAIDQIEDSVTALEFKAYNDVKTWVSAAMSDAASCDMGFKDRPGYKNPIAPMTTTFDQICSIILAITQQLLTGGNSNVSS